jgi:hypothetical protein
MLRQGGFKIPLKMRLIIPGCRTWQLVLVVVAGSCLRTAGAAADDDSSLTDSNMNYTEAKVALDGAEHQNTALRSQLALVRQQIGALTDALVLANSESEVFKRETTDLKMQIEALGLESASPDRAPLEQRLLKAVSDLKIIQDQRDQLSDQLIRINEAILRYVKTASSVDGDARMQLETEMRSSQKELGLIGAPGAQPAPASADDPQSVGSLTDARVISVKDDLDLVVANIGRKQGVKIGMPFQVWHNGNQIGVVRVVDVRESIAGAVIQSLDPSAKIKAGDFLRVDARM